MTKKTYITPVMTKFDDDLLEKLDAWRRRQGASPTRSEVIRAAVRRFLIDEEPKEQRQ